MSRWQRYWFADGGRTALAIVRIALAASVLLTLAHLAAYESPISSKVYRPVGLWMLLGHTRPPAALVDALWIIAVASTACMGVGLKARLSTAVSFVSAVALAALSFSASKTWSHQYNVVFIAQAAFLGARAGDTLSVDAWLRARRGLAPIDIERGYQWSLRLVQFAVVLMFAGAAFHKLAHGHFTLRWAFSDNLRHHLLVRYDLAGTPRPAFVDWLLAESWRYQGAALLNILTQAAPLLAVVFIRRPLVRAFAGMLFVTEVILLGVVVGLWNLHWLPLVAVFIDWEWLLGKLRRRLPAAAPEPGTFHPPRTVTAFIIAFLVYDLATSFVPTLDQRLNTYPFSSFPMFATVRARAPYDEHLPYSVVSGSYEVIGDPMLPTAQRWLDHTQRNVYVVRNPVELERRLRTVLERVQHFYPDVHAKGIRLWISVFEAPAYPAPARFDKKTIAILGEIGEDGVFRTMLGTLHDKDSFEENAELEIVPRNIEVPPDTKLVYYRDDRAEPIAVPVPLSGNRFDLGYQNIDGNPLYFVAIVRGTPWLVASRTAWRWD